MNKKKITISEVAKQLNVSCSTVSRSINNAPGVSEEVRRRVLEYVSKIGYRPNTLAQCLSRGTINIVALIFGDVRNPFYADLAFHIQKILNENGYMVMVFNSEYDAEKEIEFIRLVKRFNFAGLIVVTAQTEEIRKELDKIDIPIVLVNRILESYKGSSVILDNFHAGYIATRHLIELKHVNIGFIGGHSDSSAAKQRYNGYRQALDNYKLPFDKDTYVFDSDLKFETGYRIARKFVADIRNRPSALVIVNDMTALGFIQYCKEAKVKIPEVLSIVSFDNIMFSSLYDIELTTVDQHVVEMSKHTARIMLAQLNNPQAKPERVILEPTLIVRKQPGCTIQPF